MKYPRYLSYHDRPLMLFKTPVGVVDGLILDEATGKFVPATGEVLADVAYVSNTTDVITRNRDGFILQTERIRSRSVSGVGPAFDLYRQVEGIWDTAKSENRLVTDDELARIDDIHRRTFALWEAGEAYS